MSEYAINELYARAFKFIKEEIGWGTEIDHKFVCTVIDFVKFYIQEEEKELKK